MEEKNHIPQLNNWNYTLSNIYFFKHHFQFCLGLHKYSAIQPHFFPENPTIPKTEEH